MAIPKVYWKSLRILVSALKLYIQRNQLKLSENLTEGQYACVLALLNACIECLANLPTNTPVN